MIVLLQSEQCERMEMHDSRALSETFFFFFSCAQDIFLAIVMQRNNS